MDRKRLFHVAPLQGRTAKKLLPADLRQSADLRTLVLLTPDGRLFLKSEAIIEIFIRIGGLLRIAALVRAIPLRWQNWLYDRVAANRKRIFPNGACELPNADLRQRLLD